MNKNILTKFKKEALPKIIAELNPKMILLFGSHIKDTANEDSDIDVIEVLVCPLKSFGKVVLSNFNSWFSYKVYS